MKITEKEVVAVLKRQIEKSKVNLSGMGVDPAAVRVQVVAFAHSFGNPVLDMGTGSCACMAVALARSRLEVTAIDHASSVIHIAEQRVTSQLINNLKLQYAEATHLPFLNSSFKVVTAFDVLCHNADPLAVVV